MITVSQPPVQLVWFLAGALLVFVAALAVSAFVWRAVRASAARRGRDAPAAALVEGILNGTVEYHAGFETLLAQSAQADRDLSRHLQLADMDAHPDRVASLRRLCGDLGLLDTWRRQLTRQTSGWTISCLFEPGLRPIERMPGLSFVARAEAAEHLGTVRDRASWPIVAAALDDPHVVVRSAAARALGRIQALESFAALVGKLEGAATNAGRVLSVRTLRMTLPSFPPSCAIHLLDLLQSGHRRLRFLAADVVATMLQRPDDPQAHDRLWSAELPPAVAEIFLTQLRIDENPDVRARAADVISHLADPRAATSLVTMLEDTEWFVRLHAVRALTRLSPVPIEPLRRCLTDSSWRVREAAVGALAGQGTYGLKLLLNHFVSTQDRYSREQVAEQIERMGLIPSVLAAFGDPESEQETAFVKGVIHLGRTAALATALRYGMGHKSKTLLYELREQRDSPTAAFVKTLLQMPQRSEVETPAASATATHPSEPVRRS